MTALGPTARRLIEANREHREAVAAALREDPEPTCPECGNPPRVATAPSPDLDGLRERVREAADAAWPRVGGRNAMIYEAVTDAVMAEVAPVIEAQQAEIERLREELEAAQLRSIEARNPGIDMAEVRHSRAAVRDGAK